MFLFRKLKSGQPVFAAATCLDLLEDWLHPHLKLTPGNRFLPLHDLEMAKHLSWGNQRVAGVLDTYCTSAARNRCFFLCDYSNSGIGTQSWSSCVHSLGGRMELRMSCHNQVRSIQREQCSMIQYHCIYNSIKNMDLLAGHLKNSQASVWDIAGWASFFLSFHCSNVNIVCVRV